jgi:large subunit ribosomal protein L4
MTVPVLNPDGVTAGTAALRGAVAEQEVKPHLIHETVVSELGRRRAGTHKVKDRGEVRGGGRKPWRQKGTGRARQGSTRAPHWRGGGVAFGPTPRAYGGKVNRKVRAQAFRSALRAHAERGSIAVMEPTGWDAPSAKRASAYLYQAPDGIAARPLLVVVDDPDGVEGLSFRNLSNVYVLAARDVEVVDLMAGRSLLVERAVWERFTGGELEVEAVEATAKPLPTRTPPPAPKPISRKSADEKPKRSRAKAAAEDVETPVDEVEDVEATAAEATVDAPDAAEIEAPGAAEVEAPSAEEPAVNEPAAEEKPKRARAKKAEAAEETDAAEEPAAEEKPKRARAKKAEAADETGSAEEPAAEEKPKRARAKKAEAADETDSAEEPAAEAKPKRTRAKKADDEGDDS